MIELPPTRKATVGAFASAVSLVIVWLIRAFTVADPPPEITGAIAIIIYFVATLFVHDDPDEPTETGPAA